MENIKELIKRVGQNDASAMTELAKDLLSGEAKVPYFDPITLLKRAAQQGNEEASNLLAVLSDPTSEPQTDAVPFFNSDIMENEYENVKETVEEFFDDEDITEKVLLPYERKFLNARSLYKDGHEEEAYALMEEGVALCQDEDINEGNVLLQDALVSLAAHYMDDSDRYQYYVHMGVKAGVSVLQYTAGREILMHTENNKDRIEEGISLLQKSIASGNAAIAVGARVSLLTYYLSPDVKGCYRKNFNTIAQYFVDIFTIAGNGNLMTNILLGDFLARMSKIDLTSLPGFARKVGLSESDNPRILATKAYKRTVKLASQCTDRNERALAVLAMQKIQELEEK